MALSDDGEAQGTASLVQSTLTHQHLGPWLSAVFVPPAHRGKGIASALSMRAYRSITHGAPQDFPVYAPQ
ncbi:GNAT family N-acetyltransferase [Burkholderia ubonensis]|uniref:GNAT family N-acetyltransferase n=1 Tax=Burkholderia ubonensis TaxID=101571 RepID=UPI0039F1DF98